MAMPRPRRAFGTHLPRPVGLSGAVPRVLMPPGRAIHAVAPVTFGEGFIWECLAACPFVGSREEAIAHAVARQFSMVYA